MVGMEYRLDCHVDGCEAQVWEMDEGTVGIGERVHEKGWRAVYADGPRERPYNFCPRHAKPYMGPCFGAVRNWMDEANFLRAALGEAYNKIAEGHTRRYEKSQILLTLDLGADLGWCIYNTVTKTTQAGTEHLSPGRFKRYEGGGMRYHRLRRFLNSLPKPYAIAFEAVRRHNAIEAAHDFGGYKAVLTEWCEEHNVPVEAYEVSVIKVAATGKGSASKEDMIAAARKKLGITVDSDDAADAAWMMEILKTKEGIKT